MKKRYLLILPILIFSLFGCVNSLDDNDDNSYSSSGFVTARGTICVPVISTGSTTTIASSTTANSASTTASRQAFPTATSSTLYFTLTCKSGSVTTTGTVDSSALTFTINVPVGSSTITAKAFVDSAKSQQVYEGTLSLTDVTASTDLSSQTITLNDLQSGTDATATVSLPILINSDVTISSISAVVSTDSTTTGTSSTTTSTTLELSSPTSGTTYYFAPTSSNDTAFSTTAASSANTVPGVYNVTFSFYATDSSSGTYLAYQTTQKITASNYLTTSTWTNNGADSCINSSGVLEITKSLCTSFLLTTFYVDQTNGSDTSVTGSFSSPFKSIQKAVNAISSVNDGTTTYTIYLKGDVTATSADDDFTNGSLVYIKASANVSLKIKSYPTSSTFTIDAASLGRIFYIGSGNTVTIKNVTLKNGKVTDSSATGGANGGAIFASGTFTFSGNTVVTESSDNNDVYLDNSSSSTPFITLADDFTGTSGTTSARITLASYAEDYVVLSGTNVATQYEYFKITDEGYQIGSDGKLDVKSSTTSLSSISDYSSLESGKTYSITTEEELNQLATLCNSGSAYAPFDGMTILLENDITLTCSETNLFTPIGTSTYTFAGTFDGQGHKISNLYVSSTNQVGLFAALNGGTIKNLTVEGTVKGSSASSTKYGVGGIVGYALDTAVIENCVSNVTVSSDSITHVGGICGYATTSTIIRNCINVGNVTSSVEYVGGIVGLAETASSKTPTIYNCANFGTITGTENVGGIAGTTEGDISICYNVGSVSSSSSASSVAALANVTGTDTSYYANCRYLSGSASTGFVGSSVTAGTFTASESDITNLKTDLNNFVTNKADSNLNSWDKTYSFNSLEYPVCIEVKVGSSGGSSGNSTYNGTITSTFAEYVNNLGGTDTLPTSTSDSNYPSSGTVYSISTYEELIYLQTWSNTVALNSNITFVLLSNIDVSSATWIPIGQSKNFNSTFDGNGNRIYGINITDSANYSGFIGKGTAKTTIKNLTVEGTITGGQYCGGIIGSLSGSTSSVQNCVSKVSISGSKQIGGIVGSLSSGYVINCINVGAISASDASSASCGGIVGYNSGYVYNCANLGAISASMYLGGICGTTIAGGAVYNVYNAGTITATSNAGEIDGQGSGTYSNCYYLADVNSGLDNPVTSAISCSSVDDIKTNMSTYLSTTSSVTVNSVEITLQSWDSYTYTISGTTYPVCVEVKN